MDREEYALIFQKWMAPPYVFSFSDKPSEIYRKTMFMHNYPAILKEAGYETIYAEAIQTGHPDPDYRILSFIGRLKN